MSGKHGKEDYTIKTPYDENCGATTQKTKKKKRKKKSKTLRTLVIILLFLLLILLGIVIAGYTYMNDKMRRMNVANIVEENLEISENTNLEKYRNIAIFGIDSRQDDYSLGNRSDCIIIANINNKTKEVKLISVYRDTYVQIEGYGLDKITHAYSYGGAELAIKTLNQNLDLNIKEFVTVNFDAVVDAVDALGGIKMNITSAELNYINGYIEATAANTGKTPNYITNAGMHTLDGVQAVAYSRIRYTAGGDEKRSERMRDVIEAMVDKLKTKNLSEINNIADKMLSKVYTNITMGDILSLLPSAMSFKITDSIGWPYETKGITLDRWYGIPVTLESNVTKLHNQAFGDENYEVPSTIEVISNKICVKTGYYD